MILRSLVPLVSACAVALACWVSPPPHGDGEAGVVMELPPQVGLLAGHPSDPSAEEVKLLPTDTTFAKMTYVTAGSGPADRDIAHVSIVLAGAESRSIHRPEVCLPGQGWAIESSRVISVPVRAGYDLQVMDLAISGIIMDKQGKPVPRRAHYVYWFTGTDASTASHFERIWRSVWDAVVHGVTHRWAYTSVMAMVTEGVEPTLAGERPRTDEQTMRLISYLIQEIAPRIQKDLMVH